jgi:hypothetical protein
MDNTTIHSQYSDVKEDGEKDYSRFHWGPNNKIFDHKLPKETKVS